MLFALFDSLRPDPDFLLSELSKHISDDMLAKIALTDYGQDKEQHLAALRMLRDTGTFTEPLHWFPCEVLELVRNSEPEASPEAERLEDHWSRAFACAALLRAGEAPWNYGGDAAGPSFTVIQLINSIEALPVDLAPGTVRRLAFMMLHSDLEQGDAQPIYYGIALLWLAIRLAEPPSDQYLTELAEWIIRREEEIHKSCRWAFDRWLLGIAHDPPPSKWEALGMKLANLDLTGREERLKDCVKLIGDALADSFSNAG